MATLRISFKTHVSEVVQPLINKFQSLQRQAETGENWVRKDNRPASFIYSRQAPPVTLKELFRNGKLTLAVDPDVELVVDPGKGEIELFAPAEMFGNEGKMIPSVLTDATRRFEPILGSLFLGEAAGWEQGVTLDLIARSFQEGVDKALKDGF